MSPVFTSFQWGVKHKKFQIYDKLEQLRGFYRCNIARYKRELNNKNTSIFDYLKFRNHRAVRDFANSDNTLIRAELKLKSCSVIQKELNIHTFNDLCKTPLADLEQHYNRIVRYLMLTEEKNNVQ